MINAKKIIINGVELRGDKPIDETTKKYFERAGGNISQSADGRVTLKGPFDSRVTLKGPFDSRVTLKEPFCFTTESFNEFKKTTEPETTKSTDYNSEKKPVPVKFSSPKQEPMIQNNNNKDDTPEKPAFVWKKGFLL